MSGFSGKCDLADMLFMQKTYDKGNLRVSDELECFNIFKEKTKGVIHQHKGIVVTEYNQDFIAENCKEFKIIPHTKTVKDKRLKAGEKEVTTYSYEYYGKEYKDLKEINKHGVFIVIDIHFDTLLDLIPYYPHIVTFCASDENGMVVYISSESYVVTERNASYQWGYSDLWEYYTKKLQEHYLEVCEKYFLYKINERTTVIPIENCERVDYNFYKMTIDDEIDYMHDIEYVWDDGKIHTHWTSPKMSDKHTILLHREDVQSYLKNDIANGTVKLKYVKNCEFPKDFA